MPQAMPGTGHVAKCSVATSRASQYLQQLCKHFGHKVGVSYDMHHGRAALPGGAASFEAKADALVIVITGSTSEGVSRACHIIEDHLLRFAFREALGPLAWERSAS